MRSHVEHLLRLEFTRASSEAAVAVAAAARREQSCSYANNANETITAIYMADLEIKPES